MLLQLALAGLGLSAAMILAWRVQQSTGNSGWIDVFWTFSTGAAAAILALIPQSGPLTLAQILVAAFAAAWSLRLGLHILGRTRTNADDPRYRHMQDQWGANAARQLFWHLQVQAAVGLVLAGCVMLAAQNGSGYVGWREAIATALFLTGLIGEAVADAQMRQFKRNPNHHGQICDTGLWSRSRHPNYFFEWLCWLAYPVMAIDFSGAHLLGWLSLLAPICIYWLLTRVSGIPPLEDHMRRTRPEVFAAYCQRVPAFFPRIVKR